MQIAAMILTHNNPELTQDTVDSVNMWMTKDALVVVDALGFTNFDNSFPYPLYKGLPHGKNKSPYRNFLYGLLELYKKFPHADWYCYIESDVLIVSDSFKEDLKLNADKCIGGFEYRGGGNFHVPLLNEIVNGDINKHHHLIGATQFMSHKFVSKIIEECIPEKIIKATEIYPSDHFPEMPGYAIEEELMPVLANYYYPNSVFSMGEWSKYNIRWKPDILIDEVSPSASIIHPIKDAQSPVRIYYKLVRKKFEKFRKQKTLIK